MKKIISIIGFFLTLAVQAQKPVSKPAGAGLSNVKLKNGADSMQYILGSYIAQWIMGNGFSITNPSLFANGMDNVFQNKSRLVPDSIITPLLDTYLQANQKNIAAKQEQKLFESIKDKPGIGMFPNGVRYMVLQTGKGPHPSETDSIIINMIAKLADGTVVEDTYQSKKPFEAKASSFFPGMNDALLLMTEGSRWQLYIPSALAYGDKSTALIPANSPLVIEVELVKVRTIK